MTYQSILAIANDATLLQRVAACAAKEGVAEPQQWAQANRWKLATTPGWEDDWQYAVDGLNTNQNPNIGAREDVISDAKILSAVQILRAAEAQTP